MSGIQMALLGSGGFTLYLNTTMTSASASDGTKFPNIIYGYSDGAATPTFSPMGSLASTSYRGTTIKAAYSYQPFGGSAGGITVVISGNQASNFLTAIDFNNGGISTATYGGYNSGSNYTYWNTSPIVNTTGSFSIKFYG